MRYIKRGRAKRPIIKPRKPSTDSISNLDELKESLRKIGSNIKPKKPKKKKSVKGTGITLEKPAFSKNRRVQYFSLNFD